MSDQTTIRPYTLGLMLAEFTLNSSSSFTVKPSALDLVSEPVRRLTHIGNGTPLCQVVGVGGDLVMLGLRPLSENHKHIPEPLFTASDTDVVMLFAGLVADPDAQGDVVLRFASLQLGDDVVRLARSLGIAASATPHRFDFSYRGEMRCSPEISVVTVNGYPGL